MVKKYNGGVICRILKIRFSIISWDLLSNKYKKRKKWFFMKKILLVIVFVFSFTSIVQAREVLNVAFVFDTTTTNYSSSQRKEISKNLLKKLNKSFFNSVLSSKIYFTRVHIFLDLYQKKVKLLKIYKLGTIATEVVQIKKQSYHCIMFKKLTKLI